MGQNILKIQTRYTIHRFNC